MSLNNLSGRDDQQSFSAPSESDVQSMVNDALKEAEQEAKALEKQMSAAIDAFMKSVSSSLVKSLPASGDDGATPGDSTDGSMGAQKDTRQQTQGYRPLFNENVPGWARASVPPAPVPGSTVTWNGGNLTDAELQIVAVLDRHKDQCPLSWDSLQDKINDPSTPPDLKSAIEGLRQDPRLFFAIGSQGDGRCGGKIKANDLSDFSANHAQVATFKEKEATNYEENYIPSDGTGNGQLSVMAESDALRELFRYSDNLPKHLSQADFKRIVDGDAKTGKTPPQVIAAAQYFLDHPASWRQLNGGADEVGTADFLSAAASSMNLSRTELNTLDTINRNQNAFFGDGDLTRDKLASMSSDGSLDAKVRQAAAQLQSDPLLFSLLNNSITGYKTHHGLFDFGGGHTVDSGNISNNDFTHFYGNMSASNRTVQQATTHAARTDVERCASVDMMMGVADQPNVKTPKHNGGTLMHAVDDVLKVGAKAFDWAATALGALSFIPGVGELADLGSEVLESESQAMNIMHTVISGGNLKEALEEAGLSLAAQAVGDISGPEAKIAMRDGLTKTLLEKAATAGIHMPIEAAKSYTESYLNYIQARLQGGPVQGAGTPFSFTQSLEEGGLGSASNALDDISGPKRKLAMSGGLAKKTLEKAVTATVNLPLSEGKAYSQSALDNLQAQVAVGPAQQA
ncbi:HrpF/NolX family T3SS translocon protein (plasmid) [Robbsia andropogonis]|uniref:HrpF/NolX family T3SS translocon protein n=1 Tax=Robbsia andropogonis TaxID=28092 RepID=UPI003D1FC37A